MSKQQIIHAYRHLYRGLLRAVQFSKPARFVGRDKLRDAFREKGATFDAWATKRTVWFLNNAARDRGIEHKILRNLLKTTYTRSYGKDYEWTRVYARSQRPQQKRKEGSNVLPTAFVHYDRTIDMLNKTMRICLR